MVSTRLECPLCCNETFPTPTSLKYHLLNIIDNLLCTVCGKKFNSVRGLAEHLGGECKINKKNEENGDAVEKTSPSDEAEKATTSQEEHDKSDGKFDEIEDTLEKMHRPDVKIEQDDIEEEVNELAEVEGETEETSEEVFYCSTCTVSFTNIDKHLEEFHQGQEVYVEDEQNAMETQEETVNAEEDACLQQTIQEEECTDKQGISYTRKVVQIEKFWDEKKSRPDPIIQYFNINEGVAIKIEKDEIDDVTPQNILQVFQCSICSVHFTKEKQYQTHKCTAMKYQCTECDASFPQRRSLSGHMRLHSNTKTKPAKAAQPSGGGKVPHICEYCSTPFNSYKSLRLHLRMHDPIKSKEIEPPVSYGIMGEDLEDSVTERIMFTCTICNKDYDEVYREVHMKSHSVEENYNCEICNRKFFTESNLEMHMRVHSTEKSQTCSYCKQEFTDYTELQEHMKIHIESRPYQCQYCSRRFIRPHEKVKHERIHTGEKPHVCELCGKAFRVSYCLTLHMRTHSGTRPYQCQQCGKRFKAHSVYNHHLLIHSNVRKYKCPYCPKAFKTAVQLAGHKNTHTKPFTCTECNRPFASLYAVRSHMETHKQENNLKYNCLACGASYARAFALKDHIKAHHDGEQWDEEMVETVQENTNATETILQEEEVTEGEIQDVLILDEKRVFFQEEECL